MKNVSHALMLGCLLLLQGVAAVAAEEKAAVQTEGSKVAVPAAQDKAEPPASVESATDYVIGPGDQIRVFVWREPDLSGNVVVRPDGKISTPQVEDLQAVNKTPSQLARDIEARLARYVRTPQVTVTLVTALNAFNQIKIIGQVSKPQSIAYRTGMTVLDAILEVGGLTEFAAGNRTTLVRKDEKGKEQRIKVRVEDIVKKGKLEANRELKPGDVLIVPQSIF
ncbi:MAG TPA: XrtA/PEP-CTERM system exopolysaccharide export protein [Steroidobacteraceae bacterium]|nr:XrtA/PEP-CTERM system exopolysaccharide export protein [Steroidobacteraceae bacterium]